MGGSKVRERVGPLVKAAALLVAVLLVVWICLALVVLELVIAGVASLLGSP